MENAMEGKILQERRAQVIDGASQIVDMDRMMPGLVTELVETFNRPKAHLTVRGAARRKKVSETFVSTALFRDLYAQMDELRAVISRRPARMETPTVRQFISQRRAA